MALVLNLFIRSREKVMKNPINIILGISVHTTGINVNTVDSLLWSCHYKSDEGTLST